VLNFKLLLLLKTLRALAPHHFSGLARSSQQFLFYLKLDIKVCHGR